MTVAARLIGLLIAAQGIVGLAVPDIFVSIVSMFQTPPVIYLAAVIRIIFGVVLFRAAPGSRVPNGLRILGVLIFIGGILTPFIGVQCAHIILGWWSEGGAALVRAWAVIALAIGAFVVYATAPNRRAA